MKRFWLFMPLVVAIIVGVVLFAGIGKDPTKLDSALIGKPVPAFSLKDLKILAALWTRACSGARLPC